MATGNLIEAEVKIKGTRPFLWHAFGPDSIPLTKGERTGVAGNDPTEWLKTVRRTKDGQLFSTPEQVFGTLVAAAKFTKERRGSIQSNVQATLQVTDGIVLMDRWLKDDNPSTDFNELVYLDIRSVVNPSTKGRNVRYRIAASAGWELTFHLLWDKTVVSRTQMEAVVIDGGKLVGIGSGRKIGMGRFQLVDFKVTSE